MGAGASRAEGPCHRSLDANHATVVEYVNCTDYTVHTYWISYAGAEKRYSCLAPGASVQQPTFTSHPWTFAAPNAPPGTLCVVQSQVVFYPPLGAPGLPPPQARIECAGSLPWYPPPPPQNTPPRWLLRCSAATAACRLCHWLLALLLPAMPMGGRRRRRGGGSGSRGAVWLYVARRPQHQQQQQLMMGRQQQWQEGSALRSTWEACPRQVVWWGGEVRPPALQPAPCRAVLSRCSTH